MCFWGINLLEDLVGKFKKRKLVIFLLWENIHKIDHLNHFKCTVQEPYIHMVNFFFFFWPMKIYYYYVFTIKNLTSRSFLLAFV